MHIYIKQCNNNYSVVCHVQIIYAVVYCLLIEFIHWGPIFSMHITRHCLRNKESLRSCPHNAYTLFIFSFTLSVYIILVF